MRGLLEATGGATGEPERVVDTRCHTGEGPLYHPDEGAVFWVDIPNGDLFRYDPATGGHGHCYGTDVIGGFTIERDGALLLFEDGGRIERLENGAVDVVRETVEGERDSRFNDVVADPRGRVFAGTMPTDDRLGRLYRIGLDGKLERLRDGIDIPNGMGFSPDGGTFYVTESKPGRIDAYDYDPATGELSNRSTFVDCADETGIPDGLTVDTEGRVWSARWNGGSLVCYSPAGEELRRIGFPARKVSSATFGGPNNSDLYVTTAGGGDRATEGDGAGALFRLSVGATGRPEFRSALGV
ncbi:MAG: SMP-30/gluconolactonase/LRE family protein [Salinirussus sp.]